ncbi:MAG: acetamidase/formamidase family protein [Elainellaceae cyanobacterium]
MKPDAFVAVDRSKPLAEQTCIGHNRWHPEITPLLEVEPGQVIGLETLDGLDGQVHSAATHADISYLDFHRVHPLTGPVYVKGAEPGDMLEIEVVHIDPQPHGFTMQAPGFGFLRDIFTEPYVVHWDIADGYATSAELPGVKVPGASFMGVMGVAPSPALLEQITVRETDLHAKGGMVLLPDAKSAFPGAGAIASRGMRTIAPHETGGNVDIKQLTTGTTVRIPVYVPGALFSVGDGHFAQGDAEACGTAIEMGATFYASFKVIKGEAERRGIRDLQFYRNDYFMAPEMAVPQKFFATTGQCYTRDGESFSENLTLAARNALLNMIDYLVDVRHYTAQQAYAICSVAVDLRVSQIVDVPNFTISALLPLEIFV